MFFQLCIYIRGGGNKEVQKICHSSSHFYFKNNSNRHVLIMLPSRHLTFPVFTELAIFFISKLKEYLISSCLSLSSQSYYQHNLYNMINFLGVGHLDLNIKNMSKDRACHLCNVQRFNFFANLDIHAALLDYVM